MKKNLKSLMAVSVAATVMLMFASCSKTNEGSSNIPVAGLMAFNLAPDRDGIGITLSGNQLPGAPLMYSNYTGTYLGAYPGTRSIIAYDYFMNSAITSSKANLDPGKYYSLFVVGNNNSYSNLVVKDDFDSLSITKGEAYIRYVNAIPDSSKPSVTINAGGKDILNEYAGFKKVSAFVPVTAGQVKITVTNGGNINSTRTINISAQKVYTVLLAGIPEAQNQAKNVQIRYVENGSLSDTAANKTSVSVNAANSN